MKSPMLTVQEDQFRPDLVRRKHDGHKHEENGDNKVVVVAMCLLLHRYIHESESNFGR